MIGCYLVKVSFITRLQFESLLNFVTSLFINIQSSRPNRITNSLTKAMTELYWWITDWLKHIMWLTSGISWTFVVDSFSSGGSFPWHGEKVLVFTYLMRSCKKNKREIYRKSEMKRSRAGTQKNHHAHTPTDIASKKKGGRKGQKTRYKSMFSCSSSQSYSLVHCSVLSVSVTASVQYLIPSSSYSLSLFICFSPLPLFHNPDEKKWGRVLWRYSEGADECWQRRSREMKRDEERGETHKERKYDTMFPCNANWKRSSSCVKEAWELLKTNGSCWRPRFKA